MTTVYRFDGNEIFVDGRQLNATERNKILEHVVSGIIQHARICSGKYSGTIGKINTDSLKVEPLESFKQRFSSGIQESAISSSYQKYVYDFCRYDTSFQIVTDDETKIRSQNTYSSLFMIEFLDDYCGPCDLMINNGPKKEHFELKDRNHRILQDGDIFITASLEFYRVDKVETTGKTFYARNLVTNKKASLSINTKILVIDDMTMKTLMMRRLVG